MRFFIIFFVIFHFQSCSRGVFYRPASKNKLSEIVSEVSDLINSKYFENINEEDLSNGVALGLILKLDEYSDFFSKEDYKIFNQNISGNIAGIGVEVVKHEDGAKIMSVITGSSAEKIGLKSGDIIFKVDKISVDSFSVAKIGQLISGEIGTLVSLSIIDGKTGIVKSVVVKRQLISTKSVEVIKYDKIPIIKIKYFAENTVKMLENELIKLKKYKPIGIILDLRDNPGGLLESAHEISSIFLPKGSEIATLESFDGKKYTYFASGSGFYDFYKNIPIVIIINEGSASGSEILASAIKENKRGKVVGVNSFGKGTVQDVFELNSIKGSAVKLTIAEYFGPNNVKINKKGVIPDLICEKKSGCESEFMAKKVISSYY